MDFNRLGLWMFLAFGLAETVGTSARNNSRCSWVSNINQSYSSILVTWSSANNKGLYAVRFWPLYLNHSVVKRTVNQTRFLATRLEPFTFYKFDIREKSTNSLICAITARTKTGYRNRNGLHSKRINSTTIYVEWMELKRKGFHSTYRAFIEWGSDDNRYVGLVYSGPKNYTWIVKDKIPEHYSIHVNVLCTPYKEVPVIKHCKSNHSEGITWPETKIGDVTRSRCPHGAYGNATRKCQKKEELAVWEEPDYSDCVSEDIASIHDSLSRGNSDTVKTAKQLAQATKNKRHKYSREDIKLIVSSLDFLAGEETTDKVKSTRNHTEMAAKDLAVSVLNVSNGILDEEALESWKQIPKASAASLANKVIQSLDKIAVFLASNNGKHDVTLSTDNVALSVKAVPREKSDVGQRLFSANDMRDGHTSSVFVPGSVFGSQNTTHDGLRYLALVTYKTINKVLQIESAYGLTGSVQAPIMSVTLKPLTKDKFEGPVILTIAREKSMTNGKPTCAFLDISNSSSISWSSEGCKVGDSNKTHTQCLCYHLTSFAILMQVTDADANVLEKEHQITLSLITYIGICTSVLALLAVFLTFTLIRFLNLPRHMIHANLALSLTLAHVTFLFGIDKTESKALCKGVAISLHYLFLVAFSWMALEGVVLYLMLVKVFNSSMSTNKTKLIFIICGWGIPGVIVGISSAVYHEGYGTDNFCWLSLHRQFIWAFVAPVLAVITFNFVCLGFTFYIMAKTGNRSSPKKKVDKLRYWVRSCCLLTCILGVTWLLGVFYVNKQTLFMAYLFSVLNGFQGLVIFLLHCIGDRKIRAVYINILHCHTGSYGISCGETKLIRGGRADSTSEQKLSPERRLMKQEDTSSSLLRSPEVLQHIEQAKEQIDNKQIGQQDVTLTDRPEKASTPLLNTRLKHSDTKRV